MKRNFTVESWQPPDDLGKQGYDLLVAALGYESRARFAPSRLGDSVPKRVAIGFGNRHVLEHETNRRFFVENGYDLVERADHEFENWWNEYLRGFISSHSPSEPPQICIDISSFSRFRIAAIVEAMHGTGRDIIADFVYSPAEYSPPPRDPDVIQVCGPVTSGFAGWAGDPRRPLGLVIGLGYEPAKALGIVEYLEPKHTWLLEPYGPDFHYDRAVHRANRQLLEGRDPQKTLRYPVVLPQEALAIVEGVAYSQLQSGRLVLIPFGPKIFALCCLLVACMHSPRVAVWRVSSGDLEAAMERRADGSLIGLTVKWS